MSVNIAQDLFDLRFNKLSHATPWSMLQKAWKASTGYPVEKFDVDLGKTPMTTFKETAFMVVLYYAVIFGGREIMRNRPAYKLNDLFLLHNLALTLISGALLALFVEQLAPTVWRHGLFFTICGDGGWTQALATLYYLNYLTKYVELLDTVFLFLKKKPLTFLHCYHHPATALLCYTQLVGHTPVSWVPITLNLSVHVVMYWYYFQSARGIKVSWKEWITRMQIAQFVIDLGFIYFATYNFYASAYFPWAPHIGTCQGEEWAAFTGCAIISSYLFLFISFYLATYKKKANRNKSVETITHKTLASMETTRVPNVSETTEKAHDAFNRVNEMVQAAHVSLLTTTTDMGITSARN